MKAKKAMVLLVIASMVLTVSLAFAEPWKGWRGSGGMESLSVHLGPDWYIERLDTKIEKGDKIEVKGSRVTFNGNPTIIASEVKKGDNVLKLRDENSIPAWAG